MKKDDWNENLNLIKSQTSNIESAHRRQVMMREKVLGLLKMEMKSTIVVGNDIHNKAGDQVDSAIDFLMEKFADKGRDLDGELLDVLIEVSATITAIQKQWVQLDELLSKQ